MIDRLPWVRRADRRAAQAILDFTYPRVVIRDRLIPAPLVIERPNVTLSYCHFTAVRGVKGSRIREDGTLEVLRD